METHFSLPGSVDASAARTDRNQQAPREPLQPCTQFDYEHGGKAIFHDDARVIRITMGPSDEIEVDLRRGTLNASSTTRVQALHRLWKDLNIDVAPGVDLDERDETDDPGDWGDKTHPDDHPKPSGASRELTYVREEEDEQTGTQEVDDVHDAATGGEEETAQENQETQLDKGEVARMREVDHSQSSAFDGTAGPENIERQAESCEEEDCDDPFGPTMTPTSSVEPHEYTDGGPVPTGWKWDSSTAGRWKQANVIRFYRRMLTRSGDSRAGEDPKPAEPAECPQIDSKASERPGGHPVFVERRRQSPPQSFAHVQRVSTRRKARPGAKHYRGQMALWPGFGLLDREEIIAREDVQAAVLKLQRYDLFNPADIVLQVGPQKVGEAVGWFHRHGGSDTFHNPAAAIAAYCLKSRHRFEVEELEEVG